MRLKSLTGERKGRSSSGVSGRPRRRASSWPGAETPGTFLLRLLQTPRTTYSVSIVSEGHGKILFWWKFWWQIISGLPKMLPRGTFQNAKISRVINQQIKEAENKIISAHWARMNFPILFPSFSWCLFLPLWLIYVSSFRTTPIWILKVF